MWGIGKGAKLDNATVFGLSHCCVSANSVVNFVKIRAFQAWVFLNQKVQIHAWTPFFISFDL